MYDFFDDENDAAFCAVDTEFVNRDVAVVELFVNIPGVIEDSFAGIAKRDPIDKPNDELALKLAYARAFTKIASRLQKQADGLVKHADDMREAKLQSLSINASEFLSVLHKLAYPETNTNSQQKLF